MALTIEERRQLRELAGEFAHDNPRLARALAGRRYARRVPAGTSQGSKRPPLVVWDWMAVVLTAVGFPVMVVGAVLGMPVLIAIGAIALVAGPALFTARQIWQARWP